MKAYPKAEAHGALMEFLRSLSPDIRKELERTLYDFMIEYLTEETHEGTVTLINYFGHYFTYKQNFPTSVLLKNAFDTYLCVKNFSPDK